LKSLYLHEKQEIERKNILKNQKLLKKNSINRDILTQNYKTRINNTVLRLTQDAEQLPRPERVKTPDNIKRSCLKSTGFASEEERILEAKLWHSWLDTTPAPKTVFKLRPREKSKEIQPTLKVNLQSEQERLQESVFKQKEIFDSSEPPTSDKKGLYKDYQGANKSRFSGGKNVLDYYHFKTYFKTIESLALDIHESVRNMSRAEMRKRFMDEKLGMSEGKDKPRNVPKHEMCKEDVGPLTAELMEKYGLWKCRQPFMKKDSSRFISSRWERTRARSTVPSD
jgi:hypothetical protein